MKCRCRKGPDGLDFIVEADVTSLEEIKGLNIYCPNHGLESTWGRTMQKILDEKAYALYVKEMYTKNIL